MCYLQPLFAQQKGASQTFGQPMFRQIQSNVVSENLSEITKSTTSGLIFINFNLGKNGIDNIEVTGSDAPKFLIDGITHQMRLIKASLLPKNSDSSIVYTLPVFFNFSATPSITAAEQKDIRQVLEDMEKLRLRKSDVAFFKSVKSSGNAGTDRNKVFGFACVLLPTLYFYTPVVD